MLIISVVMFTVANTVSASILERTTEIGTIRALGLRRSTVMQLFLLEATILALVGTLLGIAGSVSMELLINALQLTWFLPGGSEHMPLTVSVFRGSAWWMKPGDRGGVLDPCGFTCATKAACLKNC